MSGLLESLGHRACHSGCGGSMDGQRRKKASQIVRIQRLNEIGKRWGSRGAETWGNAGTPTEMDPDWLKTTASRPNQPAGPPRARQLILKPAGGNRKTTRQTAVSAMPLALKDGQAPQAGSGNQWGPPMDGNPRNHKSSLRDGAPAPHPGLTLPKPPEDDMPPTGVLTHTVSETERVSSARISPPKPRIPLRKGLSRTVSFRSLWMRNPTRKPQNSPDCLVFVVSLYYNWRSW